jgi:hypothetical protein
MFGRFHRDLLPLRTVLRFGNERRADLDDQPVPGMTLTQQRTKDEAP